MSTNKQETTLGSLFDGSGGFPLAGSICGIRPVWASEIEPDPIAVTRSRFPAMEHLGSVTHINGGVCKPVDIVTFGSPCQGLSHAGLQKGLSDDRSGLFMEAVRIIKEMRDATNGRYPTFAVWENVPGAFTTNGGQDFRTVLEELIKIVEPSAVMPEVPKKGWAYADCYVGDGWSIAYRVFDTQFWGKAIRRRDDGALLHRGTPQRRSRIYLVLDLRGQRAGQILFEPKDLQRNLEENGSQGEETTDYSKNSIGTSSTVVYAIGNGQVDQTSLHDIPGALNCMHDQQAVLIKSTEPENTRYVLRRITPTECARLQGFPDKWGHPIPKDGFTDEEYRFWLSVRNTHAEINGKAIKGYTKQQMVSWYNRLHTDTSEYKMWGNGVALPPTLFVLHKIRVALTET